MRRLVVDIIENSTVTYCVRIGKTATDLTLDCSAADLRVLKSCIETTLDESKFTTCELVNDAAVAVSPTQQEHPVYRLVVAVETTEVTLLVHRQRLTEFVVHDIESALAL